MDGETICRRIEEVLANKHMTDMEKFQRIKEIMNEWDEYACWGDDR